MSLVAKGRMCIVSIKKGVRITKTWECNEKENHAMSSRRIIHTRRTEDASLERQRTYEARTEKQKIQQQY